MEQQKFPTISIIGCGGCGCNILHEFIEKSQGRFAGLVTYKAIDTAQSNFNGLKDIDPIAIDNLGSGKDRSKCYNTIKTYLDNHQDLAKKASDITIMICSMAGGSGNVIATVLSNMIYRHDKGKAVVIIGICDSSSQRDCMNSIAALKTFNKLAKDLRICLPTMLFSNTLRFEDNPKPGRQKVNNSAISRLIELIGMLTDSSVSELDYTDKLTFLRPMETECEPGICTLVVTGSDSALPEYLPGEVDLSVSKANIIHGLLAVNPAGVSPDDIRATVSYVGVGPTTYIAVIDPGIPSMFTEDLSDAATEYQSAAKKSTTMDKDFEPFGTENKSGLIL